MLNSTLDDLGKKYEIEIVAFLKYLTRTNTVESLQELDSQRASFDKRKQIIPDLRKRFRDSRMNATEAASKKSGSSSSSGLNSVLFKKLVEAEVKWTKLLFKEREAAILRENASLKETEANYKQKMKERKQNLKPLRAYYMKKEKLQ